MDKDSKVSRQDIAKTLAELAANGTGGPGYRRALMDVARLLGLSVISIADQEMRALQQRIETMQVAIS